MEQHDHPMFATKGLPVRFDSPQAAFGYVCAHTQAHLEGGAYTPALVHRNYTSTRVQLHLPGPGGGYLATVGAEVKPGAYGVQSGELVMAHVIRTDGLNPLCEVLERLEPAFDTPSGLWRTRRPVTNDD